MPGIILDAVAVADGAHHLDVEHGALHDPLRFHIFSLLLQLFLPPAQLFLNADDGAIALVLGHHIVRLGIDGHARQIFLAGPDFSGEWIDLADRVDLIAPHLEPVALIFVGGIDLDDISAHAKRAAAQIFAALVLNIDEAAEQRFARSLLPLFDHHQHSVIRFRRADAVNAGNRGDNDNVATFEERARRAHPQFIELVIDGRFFVDVQIGGRHIRFRLVKIVVADEIFDGVVREKAFELVVELRGKRFIVGQHERRAICGSMTLAIVKVLPEPVTPSST